MVWLVQGELLVGYGLKLHGSPMAVTAAFDIDIQGAGNPWAFVARAQALCSPSQHNCIGDSTIAPGNDVASYSRMLDLMGIPPSKLHLARRRVEASITKLNLDLRGVGRITRHVQIVRLFVRQLLANDTRRRCWSAKGEPCSMTQFAAA